MTEERVGLYPGTFDPITNGHMDIILRGTRIVDTLIVGVAVNAGKGPLFPIEERMEMVREEIDAAMDGETARRIVVRTFDGLLIDALAATGYDGGVESVFGKGQTVAGAAMLVGTIGG